MFVLSFTKIRQLAQILLKWTGYGTVISIFLIKKRIRIQIYQKLTKGFLFIQMNAPLDYSRLKLTL